MTSVLSEQQAPRDIASSLDDARTQLRDVIDVLGYEESRYAMLTQPRREVTVSIPLRRDDGSVEVLTADALSEDERPLTQDGRARRGRTCRPHSDG